MAVSWTKNWSASDDGSVLGGADLKNIQDNIDTAVDLLISAPGSVVQGDVIYYNGSSWARLATGTSGKMLQTNGAGANPSWETVNDDQSQNGSTVQIVNTVATTAGTVSADIPNADTSDDPFTTSLGSEVLSRAITPASTNNFLLFRVNVTGTSSSTSSLIIGLFSDKADYGTAVNAIIVNATVPSGDNDVNSVTIDYYVQVQTTSATTFTVRYGSDTDNAFVHRTVTNATGGLGGKMQSSITITEIKGS